MAAPQSDVGKETTKIKELADAVTYLLTSSHTMVSIYKIFRTWHFYVSQTQAELKINVVMFSFDLILEGGTTAPVKPQKNTNPH